MRAAAGSDLQRFRRGLVFKAHRLCVSPNSRLESSKEEEDEDCIPLPSEVLAEVICICTSEQQPSQGVFVCNHAGRVINKFSLCSAQWLLVVHCKSEGVGQRGCLCATKWLPKWLGCEPRPAFNMQEGRLSRQRASSVRRKKAPWIPGGVGQRGSLCREAGSLCRGQPLAQSCLKWHLGSRRVEQVPDEPGL